MQNRRDDAVTNLFWVSLLFVLINRFTLSGLILIVCAILGFGEVLTWIDPPNVPAGLLMHCDC